MLIDVCELKREKEPGLTGSSRQLIDLAYADAGMNQSAAISREIQPFLLVLHFTLCLKKRHCFGLL